MRENMKDSLLALLPRLRGPDRNPHHSPTPETLPSLSLGLGLGQGESWALAASSLPQPGLDRTTQEVISGQLCGFLPHKGGSRCPRHPKYHFGNQPRDRKSNKVEIAPAASRN